MPVTVEQLKALKPFEFQNWVIQRFNGSHSPKKSGDMGIDGFSFMLHEPIQVKQSPNVGRPTVDSFETAIDRTGKKKGYIVAFSFSRGAFEEAARSKKEKGVEIQLVTVEELLEDKVDMITPQSGGLFSLEADVPLPPACPADAVQASRNWSQVIWLVQSKIQTDPNRGGLLGGALGGGWSA